MLLALGLSAILLAAIYSLLFVGAKNWRRVRRRAEIFQTGRVALERLESDLDNSFIQTKAKVNEPFTFKGGAASLSFPTLLSVVDPQAEQAPFAHPAVGLVSYAWGPSSSGPGSVLERDWTLLVPDTLSSETAGKDVFPVLISSVTFSYPYQNAAGGYPAIVWSGQWHQPDRIPAAVRVSLVVQDADSAEQVTLSKTISILHGMLGDPGWVTDAKP
jgi:hypothetical protein